MKTTCIAIIGLLTISSVFTLSSSLNEAMLNDLELKQQVESIKQTNMGSVIMDLAQLHAKPGRFAILFDAIKDLKDYLGKQLAQENKDFSEITNTWVLEVAELEKSRDHAKTEYETDNLNLKSKLYPQRDSLQKVVAELKVQLQKLNKNKEELELARQIEIKAYKAALADYIEGMDSIKRALPLLKSLKNDESFLEVNQEIFTATTNEMKQKLGKLSHGIFYTSFVETLETMLKGKNFSNQADLQKVIDLLESLLTRLVRGHKALEIEEAANLIRYNKTYANLVKTIKATAKALQTNELHLLVVIKTIEGVEKHRDAMIAQHDRDVLELIKVQKTYAQRKTIHKKFTNQIAQEQETIARALAILAKAGITRTSK